MSSWLSEREQRLVAGAEAASAATPIPTQIVSNGEYLPPPQSKTQKRVEQWCVEAESAEEARELLATGVCHRCEIGDCVKVEVERIED